MCYRWMSVSCSSQQFRVCHKFNGDQLIKISTALLQWYDAEQRNLPWRYLAKQLHDQSEQVDHLGYIILVSEIMLQQTQVATVEEYYKRWMARWPTLPLLANASLEEVYEQWSGLGYYSRARRLHEAAKQIVNSHQGFPRNAKSLQLLLPGVGRYTAAAVSSIAFNETVGVVDGNVRRVFARWYGLGLPFECLESNRPEAEVLLWRRADDLVRAATGIDSGRSPGDVNQALMEFGARVCTPRRPDCSNCPVRSWCSAHRLAKRAAAPDTPTPLSQSKINPILNSPRKAASRHKKDNAAAAAAEALDIEECPDFGTCPLCLPVENWNIADGAANLPRRAKRKSPRVERRAIAVLFCGEGSQCRVYMERNLDSLESGASALLNGLWEFPSSALFSTASVDTNAHLCTSSNSLTASIQTMDEEAIDLLTNKIKQRIPLLKDVANLRLRFFGEILHIFSHIRMTYRIYVGNLDCLPVEEADETSCWLSLKQFASCATSTAMRKVLACATKNAPAEKIRPSKRSSSTFNNSDKERHKQTSLNSFFTKTK